MAYTTKPAVRRSRAGVLWAWVIGLVAVIAVAWIVIEALDDDTPEVGVTTENIAENMEAHLGKTVTVSGEVKEEYAGGGFAIADRDWGLDDRVLVVGAGFADKVNEGDEVQVTGEVRRFVLVDVERDLGIDLDDELYRTWYERPVLIASSVNVVESH